MDVAQATKWRLQGKMALVTGGTTGIGYDFLIQILSSFLFLLVWKTL